MLGVLKGEIIPHRKESFYPKCLWHFLRNTRGDSDLHQEILRLYNGRTGIKSEAVGRNFRIISRIFFPNFGGEGSC